MKNESKGLHGKGILDHSFMLGIMISEGIMKRKNPFSHRKSLIPCRRFSNIGSAPFHACIHILPCWLLFSLSSTGMACLLAELEDHPNQLSQECKKLLEKRKQLWELAAQVCKPKNNICQYKWFINLKHKWIMGET